MEADQPNSARSESRRRRRWPRRVAHRRGRHRRRAGRRRLVPGPRDHPADDRPARRQRQRRQADAVRRLRLLYGHMHIGHVVFRTETSAGDGRRHRHRLEALAIPVARRRDRQAVRPRAARGDAEGSRRSRRRCRTRLAPPFKIAVDDARLAQAIFVNKGAATEIDDIRARLHGDKAQWKLRLRVRARRRGARSRPAAASPTPLPYKLDADASLTQAQPAAPAKQRRRQRHADQLGAQLKLHARRRFAEDRPRRHAARPRARRARRSSCWRRSPTSRCRPFNARRAQHRPRLLQPGPADAPT